MALPPDPDDEPLTPEAFLQGCAGFVAWLVGAVAFLFVLSWLARDSPRRTGIIAVGMALVFFAMAIGRPPFVSALRFHPDFRWFGDWQKDDYIGEAHLILLGLICLAFGLYALLAAPPL